MTEQRRERFNDLAFNGEVILSDAYAPMPVFLTQAESDDHRKQCASAWDEWSTGPAFLDAMEKDVFMAGASAGAYYLHKIQDERRRENVAGSNPATSELNSDAILLPEAETARGRETAPLASVEATATAGSGAPAAVDFRVNMKVISGRCVCGHERNLHAPWRREVKLDCNRCSCRDYRDTFGPHIRHHEIADAGWPT